MNKKVMLLSLAAVSAALMALPAVAGATPAHVSQLGEFTVTGGTGQLVSTSGSTIHCTSVSGKGKYTTTTTGDLELTFHGCTDKTFGLHCQSAGQPTGTIVAKGLTFHLIMVDPLAGKTPGILITPPAGEEPTAGTPLFSSFTCFGVTTKVFGSGLIGTITSPACGGTSTTSELKFEQSATQGHQKHVTWTGKTYDLTSKIGSGGSHVTSAITGSGTTHGLSETLTCT